MESTIVSPRQSGLRVGFVTGAALIGYFLIMRATGFHEILEFRYLNLVFLVSGLFVAFRNHYNSAGGKTGYFTGLSVGIYATIAAVGLLAVFVLIYLAMDAAFMNYIIENAPFGNYLSPLLAAVAIVVEGVSSGFIATFVMMQYYKNREKRT